MKQKLIEGWAPVPLLCFSLSLLVTSLSIEARRFRTQSLEALFIAGLGKETLVWKASERTRGSRTAIERAPQLYGAIFLLFLLGFHFSFFFFFNTFFSIFPTFFKAAIPGSSSWSRGSALHSFSKSPGTLAALIQTRGTLYLCTGRFHIHTYILYTYYILKLYIYIYIFRVLNVQLLHKSRFTHTPPPLHSD